MPAPSSHRFQPRTKELWDKLTDEYEFSDAELRVLEVGLTALDNSIAAQYEVDNLGVLVDGLHQPIANPAVQIARQERAQFLAAMKQLGIADPYSGDEGKGKQGRGPQKGRRA